MNFMVNPMILQSVSIVKETEKAVYISGETNPVSGQSKFMGGWVAKSIISVDDDGTNVTLMLPKWFNNSFQVLN